MQLRVTNDTLRSIYNYFWKGDRIVFLQDVGGDENFQLFSVTATGRTLRLLLHFLVIGLLSLDVLRYIPGKEKELLVAD